MYCVDDIGENRALRFDIFDAGDHVEEELGKLTSSVGMQTFAIKKARRSRCNGRASQTCGLVQPSIVAIEALVPDEVCEDIECDSMVCIKSITSTCTRSSSF